MFFFPGVDVVKYYSDHICAMSFNRPFNLLIGFVKKKNTAKRKTKNTKITKNTPPQKS